MTIHSDFWQDRRKVPTLYVQLRSVRDSNRKKCYRWEIKHLRPVSTEFKDRQAAKGFARLCAKVAIAQLRVLYTRLTDDNVTQLRASFRAAFTKETIGRCDGSSQGVYFAAWGWTDVIIAHEVAHWADQWAHKLSGNVGFSVPYEGHGPKWRGWFAFILGKVGMRGHSPHHSDARALALTTMSAEGLRVILP